MTLRCFLFCSDEGASDLIRQVLTTLDVEGEVCSTLTTAVEKVASEPFQIVVIDWDQQPGAGMVLSSARERKPAERPLTLAIVADDASVPKALQAGANSILRKPLMVNQVTDTLTTARDLIRSRFETPRAPVSAPTSAGTVSHLPARLDAGREKLRAGEFLQSASLSPSAQIQTESEIPVSSDQSIAEPVDALKDLETVAAPAPPISLPHDSNEPRGLEWYLKKKGVQSTYRGGAAAAPALAPTPAPSNQPELLGFDQNPSSFAPRSLPANEIAPTPEVQGRHEQAQEAAVASEISEVPLAASPSAGFRLRKTAMLVASLLAAIAIVAAPQAPWHSRFNVAVAKAARSLHTWLHPQAVTAVTQAPISHEDFGRPGDEYKLPAAEPIPDATTDPSQIQVVPEVDPTAKKPPTDAGSSDQTQAPVDVTPAPAAAQTPAVQVQENPQSQPTTTAVATPAVTTPSTAISATTAQPNPAVPGPTVRTDTPVTTPVAVPPRRQPTTYVTPTPRVPSSLQSQMAVLVPDAGGNKPADAAMPAIEPVNVAELTERALLADQPAMSYPASAKGQQGTVILQVLIGRDGTVQDAKFVQGSLAFARTAIDGVRQWKFKPYTMNGRPVSVQTSLTIKFKPGQ